MLSFSHSNFRQGVKTTLEGKNQGVITRYKCEIQLSLKNCDVLCPHVRDTTHQAQAKLLIKGKENNFKLLSARLKVCSLNVIDSAHL